MLYLLRKPAEARSRFVHGLYIFGTSGGRCAEAEEFLSLMRRWAALTGIRIRKYVLMANHFHIMCEVPGGGGGGVWSL